MVDVESRFLARLSQAAILAAVRCPLDHLAPQVGGNDPSSYPLRELIRSDRSRRSDSSSAKSTNPSASCRSASVSVVPVSCILLVEQLRQPLLNPRRQS